MNRTSWRRIRLAPAVAAFVAILLAMSSVAIWLRNRYQRKW